MDLADIELAPGTMVRARGREWVVQPSSTNDCLRLRPLGGSDEDQVTLIPELEPNPLQPAVFPWPAPGHPGTHDAARLLRDALRLKLRAGAGPFRSFGNIAFEPRAYQLVPLLMALRQPTVRLLIADDVGVGKTIEGGLIARELYDRGEIGRLAVLCPPHLVDQWQDELSRHFHLRAAALTASSVGRLMRDLPYGSDLFDQHPICIVSLDYIKSERHRDHFLTIAPECVLVDEAHTCTTAGRGRQLRFELLQRLAEDQDRHLILLTATPHSGDELAFYNLLSLLRPEFTELATTELRADHPLRQRLAGHFVQRRRKDIEEWQDDRIFPRRMTVELTYGLTGRWGRFFDAVQGYCVDLAQRANDGSDAAQLVWYSTLALLRCVSSSPAAAVKALTTRLRGESIDSEDMDDDRLFDGQADALSTTDMEPAGRIDDDDRLEQLIGDARKLSGTSGDPKFSTLLAHLEILLAEGFRPVVFCRYIATAHYVAEHLQRHLKHAGIAAVTGELIPTQRETRVADLGQRSGPVVLVATDCLSEGINLQQYFTAVIHYDLAWNPIRHEQREGRVDRFGQPAEEVRCTLLYGSDNPVDGFILHVILRKAEAIRRELGVLVPMPEDQSSIKQALLKAALLRREQQQALRQDSLDFGDTAPIPDALQADIDVRWRDAMERAKANRTVFAQRRLRPDEVLPEWQRQRMILGDEQDVRRFVSAACARLGAPMEPLANSTARLLPQHLPTALRERLADAGYAKPTTLDFRYPPSVGARFVHRSHPVVSLLADHLLESVLELASRTTNQTADRTASQATRTASPLAARTAVTVTDEVDVVTTLYLLRLRHHLDITHKGSSRLGKAASRQLLAEETRTLAVRGRSRPVWLEQEEAAGLIDCQPTANLSPALAEQELTLALAFLRKHHDRLDTLARERADALLADHRRIREAARDIGQYSVRPNLPVDLIGVYVLLPDSL